MQIFNVRSILLSKKERDLWGSTPGVRHTKTKQTKLYNQNIKKDDRPGMIVAKSL